MAEGPALTRSDHAHGLESEAVEEKDMHIVQKTCDCSDLQIDVVGCDCGGTPRPRMTLDERIAEQDRVAGALIDKAMEREFRAEQAYWEAEMAKDEARVFAWDPSWDQQPSDEHVRAYRTLTEPTRLAA
jgi:hypothetical protein